MDDLKELCRHIRAAQRKAEEAGFVRTAAALAAVAEAALQGGQVDAGVILRLSAEDAKPPTYGLRIHCQTRH